MKLKTRNVEETRSEQLRSRLASLSERRRKLEEARQSHDVQALKDNFDRLAGEEQRKRQAREE